MPSLTALYKDEADSQVNLHRIRDLTPGEFAEHDAKLEEFIRLRRRFSLLHVAEQNFAALAGFLAQVSAAANLNGNKALAEANRHFMNYFSSAYALRQHLNTSLIRDFGRNSGQVIKFQKFLSMLEEKSFDYAFVQDFRNFVQHCGFPVGEMRRTENHQGRALSVKYSKAALLSDYNEWGKSKLAERPEGEFDLMVIVQKHHALVVREFSVVIQAEYGQNLDAIEAYFVGLHEEAKKIAPNAVAKIVDELPDNPYSGTVTFRDIPRNPLAELGLTRKKPAQDRRGESVKGENSGKSDSNRKAVRVVSHRTEERDRYFDIRKSDVLGFYPQMHNLDHDPFPEARNDEVVRRVFMGKELVLFAKLKGPAEAIDLGMAVNLNGGSFALDKVTMGFDQNDEEASFDVEGSTWLTYTEPLQLIAAVRNELAKKLS